MNLSIVDPRFVDKARKDGAGCLSEACDTSGGEITGDQLKLILSRGERTLAFSRSRRRISRNSWLVGVGANWPHHWAAQLDGRDHIDIVNHFRDQLGIELAVYDGGAQRTNLDFAVVPTTGGEKFAHVYQVLMFDLPPEVPGGAIVYCASRRRTEELAQFLAAKGLAADCFHAGLPPERRKDVQQAFISGRLRVIVATNAFDGHRQAGCTLGGARGHSRLPGELHSRSRPLM